MAARAEGIDERHARSCRSRDEGGRCNCSPSYQVNLWDGRSQRRIRKTFPDTHGGEGVAAGRRGGAQSGHAAGIRWADGQAGC
jgi:hypothetical protein